MRVSKYTEDNLVEKPAINLFKSIGYEYFEFNDLVDGGEFDGCKDSILLRKIFVSAIKRINKDRELGEDIIKKALSEIERLGDVVNYEKSIEKNKTLYGYIEGGMNIIDEDNPEDSFFLKIVDVDNVENNSFVIVNQFVIKNKTDDSNSRPDLIAFINGIPIGLFEFKNPSDYRATLTSALDGNIKRYKEKIPQLFSYNHVVILSDSISTKVGSMTSNKEHFSFWKVIESENEDNRDKDSLEILIKGLFDKNRIIDYIRYFSFFEGDKKIIAKYHQYYSANKTIKNIKQALNGELDNKIGTLWHTTGSGKTKFLVFLVKKCKQIFESPGFVFLTDRKDLKKQMTDQFEEVNLGTIHSFKDFTRMSDALSTLGNGILSSTIQLFARSEGVLNNSSNIIVVADEAHRSQYRKLAGRLREALPNASFIGLTGTPISFNDRDTNLVFGENISEYTVTKAQEDGVVVPIYYDFVAPSIGLKQEGIDKFVNYKIYDPEEEERLNKTEIEREEMVDVNLNDILESETRLEKIAENVIERLKNTPVSQKALFAANTRRIAFKIHKLISEKLPEGESAELVLSSYDNLGEEYNGNKNVSEIAEEFKNDKSNLRIVFVCDMWLTGFDAPHLYTLFLDKNIRGHSLMQAISRVNRIYKDKASGLIVDYIGIVRQLNKAIETYSKKSINNMDIPELGIAIKEMEQSFSILHSFIGDVDIEDIKNKDKTEVRNLYFKAFNNVISDLNTKNIDDEKKKRFMREFAIFSRLFYLIMPRRDAFQKINEFEFFERISQAVRKTMSEDLPEDIQTVKHFDNIDKYIEVDEFIKLFGVDSLEVDVFNLDVIEMLMEDGFRNIAIEVLSDILKGEINVVMSRDKIRREEFLETLERVLQNYKEGILIAKDVLAKIKILSEDVRKKKLEKERGDVFNEDLEVIFSAIEKGGLPINRKDEKTKKLLEEIYNSIRDDVSTRGWEKNEQIKARITEKNISILSKHFPNADYETTLKRTSILIVEQIEEYQFN